MDFAYQKDIQTKLKPGEFLERQEDRFQAVLGVQDWRQVAAMFSEMGADIERNPALIAEMLAAMQRLAPQQQQRTGAAAVAAGGRLGQQDAAALAVNVTKMSLTLVDNVTKLSPRAFTTAVWALAQLPDPSKTLDNPFAKTARTKVVAALGAYAIGTMHRLKAEEMFHLLAGLHLLGFRAPDRLEPKPRVGADGQVVAGRAARSFAALIESRSLKMLPYLDHKTFADAAFVVSRMVTPAAMTPEWLHLFAQGCKPHLSEMQPEALVHAGYALARNGHLPSNSWRKAYLRAVMDHAKVLEGQEFPMVLFTLARWQQQEQQQQQQQGEDGAPLLSDDNDSDDEDVADPTTNSSSSYYSTAGLEAEDGYGGAYGYDTYAADGSLQPPAAAAAAALHPAAAAAAAAAAAVAAAGKAFNPATAPPQGLIDELLLASYSSRALRELPLGQVAVILKALAGLQGLVGTTVNPMWLKRVWPAINAKIDAAAAAAASSSSSSSSGVAADLADVLEALPLLNPRPELPPEFVEGLVGNMGLGLGRVPPSKLAAACIALQQLGHVPDAIFVRQARAALLTAAPRAAVRELPLLLRAGFVLTGAAAAGGADSSSSSSSGVGEGHSGAGDFVALLLETALGSFRQQLAAAAAAVSSSSSTDSSSSSRAAKEELLSKQQQQRAEALAAVERQGLWSAATVVFNMLAATAAAVAAAGGSAAAVAAAGSSAAAAQARMAELRALWQEAMVQLAAVAPAEQLITLLSELVDMPTEHAQMLGIEPSVSSISQREQQTLRPGELTSKQSVLLAMLHASVISGIEADRARKSKTKAAAAAAAAAHELGISSPRSSFVYAFTVDDADQLLLILSDAGFLGFRSPLPEVKQVATAAADVLSGAVSDKGPAYGLSCTPAQAINLLSGLRDDFGHPVKRIEGKMQLWLQRKQEEEEEAAAQAAAAAAAAAEVDPFEHFDRRGQQQQYGGGYGAPRQQQQGWQPRPQQEQGWQPRPQQEQGWQPRPQQEQGWQPRQQQQQGWQPRQQQGW